MDAVGQQDDEGLGGVEPPHRLSSLPRRNQKQQLPPTVARAISSVWQVIETVNGQVTDQFHMEANHAHTFGGLCIRRLAKLTDYTLCIYLNRLLGNP
jgi:hypothetical protein